MESESIIPEWFFKTNIIIEPERIEFKNDKNLDPWLLTLSNPGKIV